MAPDSIICGAEDINRRARGLGLDFHMFQHASGHWCLTHAGTVALFLGTDEQQAARDCRMFLCGITHCARRYGSRPDAVQALRDRLEELSGLPADKQVDLPGWILR
jgi:hypothetical protein